MNRRRGLLVALVSVGLAVGLAVPRQMAAQEGRCEAVSGAELQSLRASLQEQASLRDSLHRILAGEGAYDSTGALLVWTDEEESKMRMALVNLDPPPEAYYRIRGLLAGHFAGTAPAERSLSVDLDAPDVTIDGDTARVCACGSPSDAGDRQIGEYMKQAIQRHPNFGTHNIDEEGRVSVFVDWQGNVLHAVVADSTGDDWLDKVLPPLAREMRFEPASVAGTPHGTWFTRGFRFRSVDH